MKGKFYFNPPANITLLNEDVWFEVHRDLLLAMANTTFGRALLCIPQEYGEIVVFKKNCVHFKNANGTRSADFRIGAKWANVIRYKWEEVSSYARYFPTVPRVLLSTAQHRAENISPVAKLLIQTTVASTLTAYPDPSPETTTVDGITGNEDPSFATAQSAASGSSIYTNSNNAEDNIRAQWFLPDTKFIIKRGTYLFDTSSIDDAATVVSGNFSVYITSITNGDNDGTDYVALVEQNAMVSNTDMADADYNDVGDAVTNPTKLAADVDITSMTTSAYNVWTLNAAGLANVSKTGVSFFGLREGHDLEGTAIDSGGGAGATKNNQVAMYFADQSGTTTDPKLFVTYGLTPTAPSALVATSADNSQDIGLTWTDNSNNETSFHIERSDTGAGGWTEIDDVAAGVTVFSDTTIGAWSATKYYRVRALDNTTGLYSSYSSTANATTAPQAPTIGTVSATSNSNNLTVTWTDNSSDESTFRVERSNNGSTGWAEVGNVAAGVQTYTDTSVGARDTQRYYRIRALRNGDTRYSGYSGTANGTSAPADPTSPAVTIVGGVPVLTWTDASSTESTFSIERKTGTDGTFAELATDTASPYTDSAVAVDQKYFYRLRALRASDSIYSGYSSTVSATTTSPAPSNLVGACSIVNAAESKVLLRWDINSLQETGFRIEKSTDNISYSQAGTVAPGIAQYEATNLDADTTYYFRVKTMGADGDSLPCTAITVLTSRRRAADLLLAFDKKISLFPF